MWSGVGNQVCLVILNLRQIVLSTGAGRRHASYFSCHCEMPGGDNSREERERDLLWLTVIGYSVHHGRGDMVAGGVLSTGW